MGAYCHEIFPRWQSEILLIRTGGTGGRFHGRVAKRCCKAAGYDINHQGGGPPVQNDSRWKCLVNDDGVM